MDHHFDVDLAVEVGVEKATILHNIGFWIAKNLANGAHEYDGHTWTYNSAKAFATLMPYFAERSIRRWLVELERDGYLLRSEQYGENPYDRTKWYALGPKMEASHPPAEMATPIGQNGQCTSAKMANDNNRTYRKPYKKQREDLDLREEEEEELDRQELLRAVDEVTRAEMKGETVSGLPERGTVEYAHKWIRNGINYDPNAGRV